MRQPRLRDSDGTVYDPDTGLPVARETQDRTWEEAVHYWGHTAPITTDDPMKIGSDATRLGCHRRWKGNK